MLFPHNSLVRVYWWEAGGFEDGGVFQVWEADVDGFGGGGLEAEDAVPCLFQR